MWRLELQNFTSFLWRLELQSLTSFLLRLELQNFTSFLWRLELQSFTSFLCRLELQNLTSFLLRLELQNLTSFLLRLGIADDQEEDNLSIDSEPEELAANFRRSWSSLLVRFHKFFLVIGLNSLLFYLIGWHVPCHVDGFSLIIWIDQHSTLFLFLHKLTEPFPVSGRNKICTVQLWSVGFFRFLSSNLSLFMKFEL